MVKGLSVRKQFGESLSYIRESRKEIFFVIALFLFSAIIGYFARDQLAFLNPFLRDLAGWTIGLDIPHLVGFILQNNLKSAFISIVFGAFMGVMPLISTVSNGVVVGYVLGIASDAVGFTSWWRLAPHGIFELPAIFISFGIGLRLGFGAFKEYVGHFSKKNRVIVYLPILLSLLMTAFFGVALALIPSELPSVFPENMMFLLVAMMFLFFTSMVYSFFVVVTLFVDRDFKRKFTRSFGYRLYNSFNVFLMVVIPLLIIAAIVEGVLIGLLP